MTEEHTQLTQEILIHSATWWMGDDEKIEFLIETILSMARYRKEHISMDKRRMK